MHPALPAPRTFRDGSDLHINGTRYRLSVLAGDETRLFRGTLDEPDAHRFESSLEVLNELAQVVTRLNERLLDPLDGMTNRAVEELLHAPEISEAFKDLIRPWAFALFKHGCNVHTERGCVIVPPAARGAFEREIAALPAQTRGRTRWKDFLDHVFDPVPLVTQGFYLFDRPADRARFERHLGPEHADIRRRLTRIMEEAISEREAVPHRQWERMDALSQRALGLQREVLERALEQTETEARGTVTRVRIRCYDTGSIRFLVRPYCYAFATELDKCAALLDRARAALPPYAVQARDVLADLADWCRTRTDEPDWGDSLPSWLEASEPDSRIDIGFTTEEKVSRLGAKGCFQLVVAAYEPVPSHVRPAYELVRRRSPSGPELNVVWLRHLLVGGGASTSTIAGEKLPDPDGRPLYKVMTFTNAVRASIVRSNMELIEASTHFGREDAERLSDAALLLVLLHEVGHTLGDFASFLGELGSSVEETNAEASVIYLAQRFAPESVEDLIGLTACWTPVLRAMQGPTEPHSHSDIVLFDELQRAGGVTCVDLDGRRIVRPASAESAVKASFALALRMRLWEVGIPSERHHEFIEPLDVGDPDQDRRIVERAREAVECSDATTRQRMCDEVVRQCRAFFAPARLDQLAAPLHAVIEHLPRYRPITVLATDDRLREMLTLT